MNNCLVVKDNTLINSSYALSLTEKRIINFCVAVAQKTKKPINHDDYVTIYAEDFAKMFGIDSKLVYTTLKTAGDTILKRIFSYSYITPKGNKGVKKSHWLQSVDYIEGEGKIKILFTKELIPFISELERNFTKYYIQDTASMTSVYAIRLYELIIAWRSCHKTPIFEIEEFRNKLGVEPNEYPRMTNFKERVLDVAVDQINELSNIRIEVKQHKKGRSITGFSFTFVEIANPERDPNTIDWVDEAPKQKKPAFMPEYIFNDDAIQNLYKNISNSLKSSGYITEEDKKLFARIEITEAYNAIINKYKLIDADKNPVNEITFMNKLAVLFGIKPN